MHACVATGGGGAYPGAPGGGSNSPYPDLDGPPGGGLYGNPGGPPAYPGPDRSVIADRYVLTCANNGSIEHCI